MKRRNVQLAFIGEGSAPGADLDSLVDGDEAVEVEIRGGQLTVVVVPGTEDDRVFEAPKRLGGQLVLEDGRTLSFEIEGEAIGALFSAGRVGDQADTHPGLSALPNVPGGA
jgi:hypothetical protein